MADDMRHFPPTEYKLEQLREEGEFPRSGALVLPALLLVVLLVTNQLAHDVSEIAVWSFDLSTDRSLQEIASGLGSLLLAVLKLLVGLGLAGAFAFVLETKFYFRLFSHTPRTSATLNTSHVLLSGFVLLAGCFLTFVGVLPQVAELAHSKGGPVEIFADVASVVMWGVFAVALFHGLLAVIWERVRFRAEHAMTRNEVEAEERETAVRPEIRDERRGRQVFDR